MREPGQVMDRKPGTKPGTMTVLLGAALVLGTAGAATSGCRPRSGDGPVVWSGPLVLGGRTVSAAQLRHGGELYTHYCRPCHGAAGDGNGASAPGLRPPARDLRRGVYKFAAVAAGQLPNDDDFVRIIKGGLHGTAMLAWDVPAAELDDLIQYTKSFAPRWQSEKPGEVIKAAPDPWTADDAGAVARGRRVYHGLAQCAVACHPAYAPKAEIYEATHLLSHIEVSAFRQDLYAPVAKDSDFGFKILPPDFTFTPPRAGDRLEDIYRGIAAGIGGTAMPTWKNVLSEADLWALAHYVKSLVALRGTRAADDLRQALLDQPAWAPPLPVLDGGGDTGDAGTVEVSEGSGGGGGAPEAGARP
jgi:mono/diheme cytochrome c family protein